MPKYALFVRMDAREGKEAEIEQFLKDGLSIVEHEPATLSWYALKLGPGSYGIFDTFPDEEGRKAHLMGEVAKALMEKAHDLFLSPPSIEQINVLAAKLPEVQHN